MRCIRDVTDYCACRRCLAAPWPAIRRARRARRRALLRLERIDHQRIRSDRTLRDIERIVEDAVAVLNARTKSPCPR